MKAPVLLSPNPTRELNLWCTLHGKGMDRNERKEGKSQGPKLELSMYIINKHLERLTINIFKHQPPGSAMEYTVCNDEVCTYRFPGQSLTKWPSYCTTHTTQSNPPKNIQFYSISGCWERLTLKGGKGGGVSLWYMMIVSYRIIIQIHNGVMWDWQYFIKYSLIFFTFRLKLENNRECSAEYCQSHKIPLWIWIMLWQTQQVMRWNFIWSMVMSPHSLQPIKKRRWK